MSNADKMCEAILNNTSDDPKYIEEGKRRYKLFQESTPPDSIWRKRNFVKESMNGFFSNMGKIPQEAWDNWVLCANNKHLMDNLH